MPSVPKEGDLYPILAISFSPFTSRVNDLRDKVAMLMVFVSTKRAIGVDLTWPCSLFPYGNVQDEWNAVHSQTVGVLR